MRIANPIYDGVFKYMMEDNKLARLLLSTILGEEITELVFCPQEHTATLVYPRQLTVYRLDFAATVKNAMGETRQVLIEIQKAKLATDIMRFRRYLGEQYQNPNNFNTTEDGKKRALPLLSVYFLGHALEHTTVPVIQVRREIRDLTTGITLKKKEDFIESLTHDSYIIQIPYLREPRRTDLEALLQIFDQHNIHDNKHTLEIAESDVPTRYRPLLRRLHRAVAEPDVVESMDVEDDILEELQSLERDIEQERAEKEKAQEQVQQAQKQEAEQRIENKRLLTLLKQAGIDP